MIILKVIIPARKIIISSLIEIDYRGYDVKKEQLFIL